MDGFREPGCLQFELNQTDISKITMSSFSIVKHLDVLKRVGTRFVELFMMDIGNV